MGGNWNGHEFPIGEAIFLARTRRNMSQAELAVKSGVHRNSIRGIERGATPPGFFVLVKIAIALDVPLSKIVHTAEVRRPAQ
jgi:transcriptional regulator with XRE-family HTH domain